MVWWGRHLESLVRLAVVLLWVGLEGLQGVVLALVLVALVGLLRVLGSVFGARLVSVALYGVIFLAVLV